MNKFYDEKGGYEMPELFDRNSFKELYLHLYLNDLKGPKTEPLMNYSFKDGKAVSEDGKYEAQIINCSFLSSVDSQKDVYEFNQEGSSIQIPLVNQLIHTSTFAVSMDIKFSDNKLDRINLFEGSAIPFVMMLLKKEDKYYPTVSINLSNCWFTTTAENDPVNPEEWYNLTGLFTGEELYLFKNNLCIARRVFKNANVTPVGSQNFFVGTWIDGKRNQLKGMISSIYLWDCIPNFLSSEIENAVKDGKGEIDSQYNDLGGESGFLGKRINLEKNIVRRIILKSNQNEQIGKINIKDIDNIRPKLFKVIGKECEYINGKIYWSLATGSYEVHGEILKRYQELNGPLGKLGFPRSNEFDGRKAGSKISMFENGAIFYSGTTGAHEVLNHIYAKYIIIGGENSFLGLPKSQEISLNGGVAIEFEGGRIYYSENTGAHEIHGDILQRYLSFSDAEREFFGFPISDEMDVLDSNGSKTGKKLSHFERGTIYWSASTGAHIVYGSILQRYMELGGPLGKLGLPLTNEEGISGSDLRYNDFENGIIVWKPEWGAKDIMNLRLRFGEVVSGQIDDGITWSGKDRSAELITYTHVSRNGTIIDNGTRRPGGHAGDSYHINQDYNMTNIKHDTVIQFSVKIYDWDKASNNDYLGSVDKSFNISTLWGLENGSYGIFGQQQLTDKGGDAYYHDSVKLSFSIAIPDVIDSSKCFRDQYWWRYSNFSGPDILSKDFYANTFTDVDIIGGTILERILNPLDTLIYELAYKDICKGGNCLGMCLEALYARNQSSLFTIPLSKYPNLNDTIRTIINRKHGYQVGADAVIWAVGKLLNGEAILPLRTLERVKGRIDRGNYPIITMMSLSKNSGHAVLAYKYTGNRIYVADPNRPFTAPTEDVGYIDIFDNNTFIFNNGSSISYQTGDYLKDMIPDTYMMEIPFHVLSSQPTTPGYYILMGLLAILGGMMFFAGDTECEQITTGNNNLYDYTTGKKRQRSSGINGLVKLPMFDTNPDQSEIYAFRGELPETLNITLKGKKDGSYTKCITTYHNVIKLEAPIKLNEKDTVLIENANSSRPAVTVKTTGNAKDIKLSYALLHDGKGKDNILYNINLQASKEETLLGIDSLGGSLIISQAGSMKPIIVEKQYVQNNQIKKTSITVVPEKENEIIRLSDVVSKSNTNAVLIEKVDAISGSIFKRFQDQYK